MTDKKIPPRIAKRPNPSEWGLDELLTLEEAAFLHWPEGPLTSRSLRSAAESGALGTVLVARKRLTSRRQIAEMCRCERKVRAPPRRPAAPVQAGDGIGMTLEEARASSRGRLPPVK